MSDIRRDDHEQRVLFSAVLEVPVQPREGHEQREENGAKRAEKAKRLSPFEFALRGPFQPKLKSLCFSLTTKQTKYLNLFKNQNGRTTLLNWGSLRNSNECPHCQPMAHGPLVHR